MLAMREDSKLIMYQFTELQQIKPLYNNVDYLSVISSCPDTLSHLQRISEQLYLYRSDNSNQVGDLIEYISRADCKHFAVETKTDNDSLIINSEEKDLVQLDLSEHTLFQNNYATRYMRFSKVVPAKSSPDYGTRYRCKVKMDPNTKYHKDLSHLILKAFTNARIQVLLDQELPFGLERVWPKYKEIELSPNSNIKPLSYERIDPESSMEYYEYFCMLHINGFPDRSNDHVKLTSMYEGPQEAVTEEKYRFPLYLTVASDINPLALNILANKDGWVSLFAKTKDQNVLITKSQNPYMWRVTH